MHKIYIPIKLERHIVWHKLIIIICLSCFGYFVSSLVNVAYAKTDKKHIREHFSKAKNVTNTTATTTTTPLQHNIKQQLLQMHNKQSSKMKSWCSNTYNCRINDTYNYYAKHQFVPLWLSDNSIKDQEHAAKSAAQSDIKSDVKSDAKSDVKSDTTSAVKLSKNGLLLIKILHASYTDGLNPNNFHIKQIDSILATINNIKHGTNNQNADDNNNSSSNSNNKNDSDSNTSRSTNNVNTTNKHNITDINKQLATLDILLTDGVILYINQLHNGLYSSKTIYPYWMVQKSAISANQILANIAESSIEDIANSFRPTTLGYLKLKEQLNKYQELAVDADEAGWERIPYIESNELALNINDKERVLLLQKRLLISGELKEINKKGKFTSDVAKALMLFQLHNGLVDSGIVDRETNRALNVPLSMRIKQIAMNLDKLRWLPDNLGEEYVFVNVPSYSLNVIKNNKSILNMDVEVGGFKNQTCILNSKINYLVINPVWFIPTSIATNELLPKLQQSTTFLEKQKIQILTKNATKNTKAEYTVIDPTTVDWKNINPKAFGKYRFQQLPSKVNPLGKVKFMFNNNCQIYLHDTLSVEEFDDYRRDFSHGCIRVAKPVELSTYILTEQKDWSKSKIDNLFANANNKVVNLAQPINLYIVYLTAWVDGDGNLQFRNDIYHLDNPNKYTF